MGCAKDEESFQLRSTAEKASFWLLSFLASPKEEVAEADNVIVKVVENSSSSKEETFTWWCRKLHLAQFALYRRSFSSFLLKLPYARSIFFFSLDATATLVHTAAKHPKMFGYLLECLERFATVCITRVFCSLFRRRRRPASLLATKMGGKEKGKNLRMNISIEKKFYRLFSKISVGGQGQNCTEKTTFLIYFLNITTASYYKKVRRCYKKAHLFTTNVKQMSYILFYKNVAKINERQFCFRHY